MQVLAAPLVGRPEEHGVCDSVLATATPVNQQVREFKQRTDQRQADRLTGSVQEQTERRHLNMEQL